MKFVFFGTDDFSVTVLDELKRAVFLPSLIITAPDRPQGRGLKILPSQAKLWAQENHIPVASDYSLLTTDYQLFIVASYGKIIPKEILTLPEKGALNVHPSLLPKYRGASPIESQILENEKEVGVTIMKMDEKMDRGPLLAQRKYSIFNFQFSKASELRRILAHEGGKLLAEVMPKWVAGEIKAVPQDETNVTYTKKFVKADGLIDLIGDQFQNFLKIRAFDGSIGTYFMHGKTRVLIKDAKYEDGKLVITRVLPEGRKEMSYVDFLRGLKTVD